MTFTTILSFFLSFFWFDLRDWKKEIERLKEEKRSNDLRDDDERMGKRKKDKSRQLKRIKIKISFIHSFISNSNISFQLWVDWLIDCWDDLRFIWEWEKNEKNQKSHFSLKIQNKNKNEMFVVFFSFLIDCFSFATYQSISQL